MKWYFLAAFWVSIDALFVMAVIKSAKKRDAEASFDLEDWTLMLVIGLIWPVLVFFGALAAIIRSVVEQDE